MQDTVFVVSATLDLYSRSEDNYDMASKEDCLIKHGDFEQRVFRTLESGLRYITGYMVRELCLLYEKCLMHENQDTPAWDDPEVIASVNEKIREFKEFLEEDDRVYRYISNDPENDYATDVEYFIRCLKDNDDTCPAVLLIWKLMDCEYIPGAETYDIANYTTIHCYECTELKVHD